MGVSLIVILLALWAIPSRGGSVKAVFNCWFETYDPVRTISIIFGTNNTGNDAIIGIAQDTNVITPAEYDGDQPYVFKKGYYQLVYVLKDTGNVLKGTDGFIEWTITGNSERVTHSDIINQDNQCKVKFRDVCPLWIEHFCEDSSFCNGEESCFTPGFNGILNPNSQPYGQCVKAASSSLECDSTKGEECSEEELGCVVVTPPPSTSAPTESPTDAPSSTESPTDAPSESPTTEEPPPPPTTEEAVVMECQRDDDCSAFSTFCHGVFKCDTLNHQCVQSDANYNPCQQQQDKLDSFIEVSPNSNSGGAFNILCVEHAQLCVETFECITDAQCDDGNVCNGKEKCLTSFGTCSSASDQSLLAVCGSDKMICTPEDGCVKKADEPTFAPTNEPQNSDTTTLIVILLVCGGVLVVIVAAIIFAFTIHYKNYYAKEKKKRRKQKKSKKT